MKKRRVRHSSEQIVRKLRTAERDLAQGATVAQVVQRLEISEQTFYRWRKKYGGMEVARSYAYGEGNDLHRTSQWLK